MFSSAKIKIGDFNAPGINWSNKSLSICYASKQFWDSLVTFTNEVLLEQIISQPTRSPKILYLCFMSHPDLSQGYTVILGLSDHDAVKVCIISHQTLSTKSNTNEIFLYKKAD